MSVLAELDVSSALIDAGEDGPINSALHHFEAEANLAKLEHLWAEISKMIPDGLRSGSDPIYARTQVSK